VIRRLGARLVLLRARLDDILTEMDRAMWRALFAPARGLVWLWNAIKAVPGVQQVGHGLATVLGLYRLDRWLVERGIKADLKLADDLAAAGLNKQADMLRTAAAERKLAND
jgi:hypothetical protein